MTVVAIGADCGTRIAAGHRFRMNAFTIGQERPIADATALHHCLVTMTAAAGLGDAGPIDCRLGIAGGEDSGHVAIFSMAIKARGSFASFSERQSVETVVIVSVRFGMK